MACRGDEEGAAVPSGERDAGRDFDWQLHDPVDATFRVVADEAPAAGVGEPVAAVPVDSCAVRRALPRGDLDEHATIGERAGRRITIEAPHHPAPAVGM